MKLDHIGIAVKDLAISEKIFGTFLNSSSVNTEEIESEHVMTSFFKSGENHIELLQPIDEKGAIAKFIQQKREGIHHIAFEVEDIYAEIERLKSEGFSPLSEPKMGANNKWIVFIHPKETNGVLIELCQKV